MLLMCRGAAPVLVIVNDCAALVVLITWAPKSRLDGLRATAGAGGVSPVPLSETETVPLGALLKMERAAVREPVTAGVNVTLMVWLPAGAMVPGPPAAANSPLGLTDTLLITNGAVPVFVSVTLWAAPVVPTVWLPKLRLVGLTLIADEGGGAPVPLSGTVTAPPGALLDIAREALRGPVAVGVNVTLIDWLAPGAIVPGPPEAVNSPPGVMEAPLIVSGAVPLFVMVTLWAALDVPTV
jgi:hypothetical protein